MPHILPPVKTFGRNGIAQIDDALYVVSWCCSTTIEQDMHDVYTCGICGRVFKTFGTERQGFWLTKAQMWEGNHGSEFVAWISAWTGIPQERISCEIT